MTFPKRKRKSKPKGRGKRLKKSVGCFFLVFEKKIDTGRTVRNRSSLSFFFFFFSFLCSKVIIYLLASVKINPNPNSIHLLPTIRCWNINPRFQSLSSTSQNQIPKKTPFVPYSSVLSSTRLPFVFFKCPRTSSPKKPNL